MDLPNEDMQTYLGDDYALAWVEWDSSDAELWEAAIADGLEDDVG